MRNFCYFLSKTLFEALLQKLQSLQRNLLYFKIDVVKLLHQKLYSREVNFSVYIKSINKFSTIAIFVSELYLLDLINNAKYLLCSLMAFHLSHLRKRSFCKEIVVDCLLERTKNNGNAQFLDRLFKNVPNSEPLTDRIVVCALCNRCYTCSC